MVNLKGPLTSCMVLVAIFVNRLLSISKPTMHPPRFFWKLSFIILKKGGGKIGVDKHEMKTRDEPRGQDT